ncbi:PorP/SprF family type IX secretion system membrane protein [Marinoscillum sp.]|uniref:PorP/SprF family type IX secretion system membrane protein n=2 Tax=Marinoscillum sp. TaxID=2024838 RepID=UPI0032F4CF63
MMKRNINIFIILILVGFSTVAQQQPQYTQFADAKMFFNPAFAGIREGVNATLLGRWQWVGFEGAPNTQAISFDSRMPSKNIGLGLMINRDEVAVTNLTSVQLNYSYQILVGGGRLGMGLSANLNMFAVNYNEAYTLTPDNAFATGFRSTKANFGTGFHYEHEKWYVGGSFPSMVNSTFENDGETYYGQKRHFYFMSGYRYQLNENFTLEPNVLLKVVSGSPLSGDFNVTSWYKGVVAAGISYRSSESIDMILQFKPMEELKVGYAYDYLVDKETSQLGNSSHEVLLSYTLPWKNRDQDNDGIPDRKDECPAKFGPESSGGCPIPDTDNDGVPDSEDECINVAGVMKLDGCPDSDKDGVRDSEDACPYSSGTRANGGCPDTDNDGVIDIKDECPNIEGPKDLGGCPDSDGDGVRDVDDKCPEEKGDSGNGGCPVISEEAKAVMTEALEGVQFQSGKDVLTEGSYRVLDKVAKLMQDNTSYKLKISGYTDSSGDDEANLRLSSQRAMSVRKYLMDKGVEASRIEARGYGEANPIADNATAKGRAKNRRVEFDIVYNR